MALTRLTCGLTLHQSQKLCAGLSARRRPPAWGAGDSPAPAPSAPPHLQGPPRPPGEAFQADHEQWSRKKVPPPPALSQIPAKRGPEMGQGRGVTCGGPGRTGRTPEVSDRPCWSDSLMNLGRRSTWCASRTGWGSGSSLQGGEDGAHLRETR